MSSIRSKWPMWKSRSYFAKITKTSILYECSTELCDLLAPLTDERAAEVAMKWYSVNLVMKTKAAEPNDRTQRRLAILKNLASLAQQARDGNKTVMLGVEYRKQR